MFPVANAFVACNLLVTYGAKYATGMPATQENAREECHIRENRRFFNRWFQTRTAYELLKNPSLFYWRIEASEPSMGKRID